MSRSKCDKPKFSPYISDAIKMMERAAADYEWCGAEQHRLEQLTQDYLHSLELDGLNYAERAKVATRLAQCRRDRRECKDAVEILEPLVNFLASDRGKQLVNLLREVLGKTRKVEEKMATRRNYPRVLQPPDEPK